MHQETGGFTCRLLFCSSYKAARERPRGVTLARIFPLDILYAETCGCLDRDTII